MNRGSAFRLACLQSRRTGFNEAPIHESGKYQAASHAHLKRTCFNEAPIHESGK